MKTYQSTIPTYPRQDFGAILESYKNGKPVYWCGVNSGGGSRSCYVLAGKTDDPAIKCTINGHCAGLFHACNEVSSYNPADFFIPILHRGDEVVLRREWQDAGDDQFAFIVIEEADIPAMDYCRTRAVHRATGELGIGIQRIDFAHIDWNLSPITAQ